MARGIFSLAGGRLGAGARWVLIPRMLTAGMLFFATTLVSGQSYPSKPIRVFTTQAGTSTDFALRLITQTQALIDSLGVRMVVENRAVIGVEMVAQAPPDEEDRVDSLLFIYPGLQCFEDEIRRKLDESGYSEIPIICALSAAVEMAKVLVNMRLIQAPRANPGEFLKAIPKFA